MPTASPRRILKLAPSSTVFWPKRFLTLRSSMRTSASPSSSSSAPPVAGRVESTIAGRTCAHAPPLGSRRGQSTPRAPLETPSAPLRHVLGAGPATEPAKQRVPTAAHAIFTPDGVTTAVAVGPFATPKREHVTPAVLASQEATSALSASTASGRDEIGSSDNQSPDFQHIPPKVVLGAEGSFRMLLRRRVGGHNCGRASGALREARAGNLAGCSLKVLRSCVTSTLLRLQW